LARLFGGFFEWWGAQLRSLIPARWGAGEAGPDALIADASTPGMLTLLRRRRVAEQQLARMAIDDAGAMAKLRAAMAGRPRGEPVLLRLPGDSALERSVTLPIAAERDLERVLGYEMERLTPFAADEVFWGYSVDERDRARARVVLRLTVVPRTTVAHLIEMLASLGGRPDMLETASSTGSRVIKLAHEGPMGAAGLLRERNLAGAAAVLLLLVLVSPFIRQSLTLAEVQDRLAAMAPKVSQAEALRARVTGAGAGGDAVAAETRRLGDTLAALAAVTEILPDDSYLTEFTMRERHITISGLGASAPKLISLLSADPRIRNPAFTAPVTRSETNHLDVFSIRAELAQ